MGQPTQANDNIFSNDSGLLRHYKLNGNAVDSKNSIDGTETSISYVDGVYGQAASFNGSSSYIQANGFSTYTNYESTINLWINCNFAMSGTTAYGVIDNYMTSNGYRICFRKKDVANTWGLTLGLYPGNEISITGLPITQSNWHMITITTGRFDGGLRLYVDGGLYYSSGTQSDSYLGYSANHFVLGKFYTANNFFNGKIDNVIVLNRRLSKKEVESLYYTTKKSNKSLFR